VPSAEQFELELDFTSPYKQTRLLIQRGRVFFGRWRPFDVEVTGEEEEYVVREGQEGQIDLIAEEFYGDRRLWRVIAQANKIDFPLEDVTPGTKLRIPRLADVQAALLATVARAARVDLDRNGGG
jgi:hypothetical protein